MLEAPRRSDPERTVRATFQTAGLTLAEADEWRAVVTALPETSPFVELWPETWTTLVRCADPGLAIGRWLAWVRDDQEDDAHRRAARWRDGAAFRRSFITLSGVSTVLGTWLESDWEGFDPDGWTAGWWTTESIRSRLGRAVEGTTEAAFLEGLRRRKAIETLGIATLDCVEDLVVDQVTKRISVLADVIVEACLERAIEDTARAARCEPPRGGFSVLALGKLGGVELNYSSDIDLNFVHDDALESIERIDGPPITDALEIGQFFTRVAQRLIGYVTKFTERGPLYRLDTRLRPDSGTGRLVWSLRASIDYYYSVGRNWERQALIRLRHVAGDEALSRRMRAELEPFIFPSGLTAEHIEEMRGLKLQIERIAGEAASAEIKIGRGGIRDVEFIVQYLQLVHGASFASLRQANVFRVLEAMEKEGVLEVEETDVLRRGYRFLRRVEHHLQLDEMLQTHRLPEGERELLRLARGVGCETTEQFRGRLARHNAEVRRVYQRLFDQGTRERLGGEDLPALLDVPPHALGEEELSVLSRYGFEDPRAAFTTLQSLAGYGSRSLDAGAAKESFRRILLPLLRAVCLGPRPDRTLANFEACVSGLGARSSFFHLLAASERTLALFVDLCARSDLIVSMLRGTPDIFDELVDCLLTAYDFDRGSLGREIERIVGAGPEAEDTRRGADGSADDDVITADLFRFKYLHHLLTSIDDLEGDVPLRVTLQRVSDIAEAVLGGVVLRAEQRVRERFGAWTSAPPRMVLLGLGKLGGREMTFQSDVDLIVLFDGSAETEGGVGSREYHERLAQTILELCAKRDFIGPLLDVDLRLRPMGSHNSLAVPVDTWRQYFESGPAGTWERQAFLRARVVRGDPALADEVMGFVRREFVVGGRAGPESPEVVRRDLREMREKLETHAGAADLKRGVGGIMDVEFLVQALQLIHGREAPSVIAPNTAVALERLQEAGLLGAAAASELLTAYRFLRWIECRFSLVSEVGEVLDGLDEAQFEVIIRKMGYRSTAEEGAVEIFRSELDYHRRRNRHWLLETLSGALS